MSWLGPWFAPFIVLAVALFLYFYGARSRPGAREAMKQDINFYLVAILATAIVAIIAGFRLEKDWLDTASWIVAGIAVAGVVWRFMNGPKPVVEEVADSRGPLEQNDDRGPGRP